MSTENKDEQLQRIHDINLSYLLLAQQLIRDDKYAASFRLGLTGATVDALKDLSLTQVIKLATINQLICQLRIDNEVMIEHLTRDSRIEALQKTHTGIILSTGLLNSLADKNLTPI